MLLAIIIYLAIGFIAMLIIPMLGLFDVSTEELPLTIVLWPLILAVWISYLFMALALVSIGLLNNLIFKTISFFNKDKKTED
jgi:uncharacterized protein YacL